MVWKPNVTVAAVVEQDGRFLLVEERTRQGRRFNQPAGHLEPHETLVEAVARETLEETGYRFTPPVAARGLPLALRRDGHHLPAFRLLRCRDRP